MRVFVVGFFHKNFFSSAELFSNRKFLYDFKFNAISDFRITVSPKNWCLFKCNAISMYFFLSKNFSLIKPYAIFWYKIFHSKKLFSSTRETTSAQRKPWWCSGSILGNRFTAAIGLMIDNTGGLGSIPGRG